MFSTVKQNVLDFRTMPLEQKRRSLEYLRIMYPKLNHFVAGEDYQCIDALSNAITGNLNHDLFFIREGDRDFAWYVGAKRDDLMNTADDPACYSVSGERILASRRSLFDEQITVHVVKVDFNNALITPSAKYLAEQLPSIATAFDISHFKKGTNVLELDSGVILMLTLSHPLVPRKSTKHPDQDRYALLGRLLGQGSYAKVYDNSTTLRIDGNHSFVKRMKPRVARFSLISQTGVTGATDGITVERIKNEDALVKTLHQHMKSKPSFFKPYIKDSSRYVAIRFERRMPGYSLEEMIQVFGIQPWSLERRLRVAIALLRALHERVHSEGIIHCDVKPANVMVHDVGAVFPEVNFIDFNLSRFKHDQSIPTKAAGTTYYFAPERFQLSFIPNEASDVFAAGVTVAELFGHQPTLTANTKKEAWKNSCNYRFMQLFLTIRAADKDSQNDEMRNDIERVLKMMVHPIADQRPTLWVAALWFEKILLDKLANDVPCLAARHGRI